MIYRGEALLHWFTRNIVITRFSKWLPWPRIPHTTRDIEKFSCGLIMASPLHGLIEVTITNIVYGRRRRKMGQ